MQDRIFKLIFEDEEVTWQTVLYQLVKQEGMNPWDIDIGKLTERFLEMLSQMKSMDFRISGKVVLAATILLRIKATRLLKDDMDELDRLIAGSKETVAEDFYEELEGEYSQGSGEGEVAPELLPRTPQPRNRKVSIYELVSALQKAIEVKHRRLLRQMPKGRLEVPLRKINIEKIMKDSLDRILDHFTKTQEKLTFQNMVKGSERRDKILTFLSLLHLANVDQRKIDLLQEIQFGDIEIKLLKPGASLNSA